MAFRTIPIVSEKPLVMVGCGILHKEVDFLIKKNGWNVETQFLASSLHNYFDRLYSELNESLAFNESKGRETVVFYGACHPRMDDILTKHHTHRTQGQNCIVMLLGFDTFMEELSNGAYFLVEDWALTWEPMLTECFGKNVSVVREIFHSSHKMIMALRTPCSTDFTAAAQAAADFVDLPLVWRDVSLDHLESVLAQAIAQK
ncbi:MAG: DUF1638 domain-containing protein [Methylococcales bacterium]|nr:DUF1638 domain-containing protein [Methylococcales bacterium]